MCFRVYIFCFKKTTQTQVKKQKKKKKFREEKRETKKTKAEKEKESVIVNGICGKQDTIKLFASLLFTILAYLIKL